MRDDDVMMVYMTAPDQATAERIADVLVESGAAACVNISAPIASVYRWEGKIERSSEVALVAKTTRVAYARLEALVKSHHPYTCPCIVAWPLADGYAPFLDWVRAGANH
jgi:periplasmic divalent cation tolerance protein